MKEYYLDLGDKLADCKFTDADGRDVSHLIQGNDYNRVVFPVKAVDNEGHWIGTYSDQESLLQGVWDC